MHGRLFWEHSAGNFALGKGRTRHSLPRRVIQLFLILNWKYRSRLSLFIQTQSHVVIEVESRRRQESFQSCGSLCITQPAWKATDTDFHDSLVNSELPSPPCCQSPLLNSSSDSFSLLPFPLYFFSYASWKISNTCKNRVVKWFSIDYETIMQL